MTLWLVPQVYNYIISYPNGFTFRIKTCEVRKTKTYCGLWRYLLTLGYKINKEFKRISAISDLLLSDLI